MNAEIEVLPSCKIVYMRQVGPYGMANAQLMEEFKAWVESKKLFHHTSVLFGIAQDNPAIVKPENCRYDACLVVPDDFCVNDDGVDLDNMAGGKYAIFTINHTAESVQQAWAEIFSKLAKEGFTFDETRPILERYKVKLVHNHLCEICVPIL